MTVTVSRSPSVTTNVSCELKQGTYELLAVHSIQTLLVVDATKCYYTSAGVTQSHSYLKVKLIK